MWKTLSLSLLLCAGCLESVPDHDGRPVYEYSCTASYILSNGAGGTATLTELAADRAEAELKAKDDVAQYQDRSARYEAHCE